MAGRGQAPDLVQGEHPITVTLFSEFVRNPPLSYFEVREGPGHPIYLHNRQKINLCTHSYKRKEYFPDSMGSEMKVNTLEELESLSRRLLKNPIFFDVFLERDSKIPMDRYRYITKGEFVVTVWPQHPAIRPQLQTLLDRAKADMAAGRKFAVELNFNPVIKNWFKTLFAADDEAHQGCYIYSMYEAKYGRLCVTNDAEFTDCYGCNCPESLILWIICFPCCLLTCPCYRVHRCFTVVDHGGEIEGSVGYQYLGQRQSQDNAVLVLVEQMRRETAAASNTQYVTTEPPQAPAGIHHSSVTSQPAATQHWVQAPGYPVGTAIPPPQHSTQPMPRGVPPSYEESVKETTSDVANLI